MIDTPTIQIINGKFVNPLNVIARCNLRVHRGYLSKNLVKSHNCISKECPFFEKVRPEYWETKEREKQEKKSNRLRRKQILEARIKRDKFIRETLQGYGSIHVTSINEKEGNFIEISYIYDRHVNLAQEIQFLREKLGKNIRLKARIGCDEAIEQLIRKFLHEKVRI